MGPKVRPTSTTQRVLAMNESMNMIRICIITAINLADVERFIKTARALLSLQASKDCESTSLKRGPAMYGLSFGTYEKKECPLLCREDTPDDPACHHSSEEASRNITCCLGVGALCKEIVRVDSFQGTFSTYPRTKEVGDNL